jgi:poly(A)-specific ribonuclease
VNHPDHLKYVSAEIGHEAGYDSLMTAKVLLRLAHKIGLEKTPQDMTREAHPLKSYQHRPKGSSEMEVFPIPGTPSSDLDTSMEKSGWGDIQLDLSIGGGVKLASDSDETISGDMKDCQSVQGEEGADCYREEATKGNVPAVDGTTISHPWIPSFSSSFWESYGNTLRVFGTQEEVMKLG